MKSGLNLPVYTFNTTGDDGIFGNDIKFYLDRQGNIINRDTRKFGIYNKVIKIEYGKLWYITKHHIGLGDIIDFFTKTLYIKQFLIWITNGNCGCETRRILFNKWIKIPYLKLNSRPLYADDDEIALEISLARKRKINFKSWEEQKEKMRKFIGYTGELNMNMENFNQKMQDINEAVKPNIPKPQPIKPENIKGGCGCSKKKK